MFFSSSRTGVAQVQAYMSRPSTKARAEWNMRPKSLAGMRTHEFRINSRFHRISAIARRGKRKRLETPIRIWRPAGRGAPDWRLDKELAMGEIPLSKSQGNLGFAFRARGENSTDRSSDDAIDVKGI